jgi:hypothetical protein
MARPQVADGGDALQVWREAANILSSCGQPKRVGLPVWCLGVGLTTPRRKKKLRKCSRNLGLGQIPWIKGPSERKWMRFGTYRIGYGLD